MAVEINSTSIQQAHRRTIDSIIKTPCVFEPVLSEKLGAKVYLKLENFQRTGSFKERGALNRLLLMTEAEKQSGVVTASAGNHAQAVAYHTAKLGISSIIFMPFGAPKIKVRQTEKFGAKVRLRGNSYDEAYEAASRFAVESGAFYLHAYNDPWVIAGQGTVGLEILEQISGLQSVIVPVGGGGLLAGISLALENRGVQVIGVRGANLAQTLADGIRVKEVGEFPRKICEKLVSNWVKVSDASIIYAMSHLLQHSKIVSEGAGATALAYLLENSQIDFKGKTICVIVSGGNIDVDRQGSEFGHKARLVLTLSDLHV
jgi:threonine dehydratase